MVLDFEIGLTGNEPLMAFIVKLNKDFSQIWWKLSKFQPSLKISPSDAKSLQIRRFMGVCSEKILSLCSFFASWLPGDRNSIETLKLAVA